MRTRVIGMWSCVVFTALAVVLSAAPIPAPTRGQIDIVAGNGQASDVGQPFGVEFGPDGGLYICEVENHRVRRLDRATGKLTIVAGTGKKGYDGDGGPAVKA